MEPTMRSAMPSPLTSPADDTEKPACSPFDAPAMRKPVEPFSANRSRLEAKPPLARPNTT